MKERPISFNAEMVRAILDGRKTQTRRVIKPQPEKRDNLNWTDTGEGSFCVGDHERAAKCKDDYVIKCPYGIPGDRLIFRDEEDFLEINLEVVSVRVERVQDITPEDCRMEGIEAQGNYYIAKFANLWDSINEKKGFGWNMNPWVWVVEFKVID